MRKQKMAKLTLRKSKVSNKQVAPDGQVFLEFMLQGKVVKSILCDSNISEEQKHMLLYLTKRELEAQ